MNDPRIGAAFRAVRVRRGWRQSDVADHAGVSRSTVAQIETGQIGRMTLDKLERVAGALEIRVQVLARWRGGELDRLVSFRHSAMHEQVARLLGASPDWVFLPEVSFSIWGERGVIDLLAWHAPTRSLLVIELKTEIVDVQAVAGSLDRYRRLAAEVARERGWRPRTVSVWLIVAEAPTNRRHVAAHRTMLRAALPLDGRAMRRWVARPDGRAVGGLSFWSYVGGADLRRTLAPRKRVRPTRRTLGHAQDASGERGRAPLADPRPVGDASNASTADV